MIPIFHSSKQELTFYISSLGLFRQSISDTILCFWPWSRPSRHKKMYSKKLDQYFSKFSDYKISSTGTPYDSSIKVFGIDNHQMIYSYIDRHFNRGFYVVLYNINPMQKSSEFWRSLPRNKAQELLKDVVILSCKDIREVSSLCESIDPSFASALGWSNGNLIDWNGD